MVGNHVADIVSRYGDAGGSIPSALTDYIKGREGYDYSEHGKAGNTHTAAANARPIAIIASHPRPASPR